MIAVLEAAVEALAADLVAMVADLDPVEVVDSVRAVVALEAKALLQAIVATVWEVMDLPEMNWIPLPRILPPPKRNPRKTPLILVPAQTIHGGLEFILGDYRETTKYLRLRISERSI